MAVGVARVQGDGRQILAGESSGPGGQAGAWRWTPLTDGNVDVTCSGRRVVIGTALTGRMGSLAAKTMHKKSHYCSKNDFVTKSTILTRHNWALFAACLFPDHPPNQLAMSIPHLLQTASSTRPHIRPPHSSWWRASALARAPLGAASSATTRSMPTPHPSAGHTRDSNVWP